MTVPTIGTDGAGEGEGEIETIVSAKQERGQVLSFV